MKHKSKSHLTLRTYCAVFWIGTAAIPALQAVHATTIRVQGPSWGQWLVIEQKEDRDGSINVTLDDILNEDRIHRVKETLQSSDMNLKATWSKRGDHRREMGPEL